MSPPLTARPVAHLLDSLRAGDLVPGELLDAAAAALRASDQGPEPVHAFLSTDFPGAARRADALARDPRALRAPLAGIPVAVKDNLATLDLPTTCASRILAEYLSPFEATAVRRLREAGALLVGKTNLDEFAMGSSTEHSAFGPTRNPLDRSRVPGGSSGGSAAAVAAGVVPAALGSETGGSVRQPAAFCGVVGLRPTYGRVSRHGLVAFASSLDQVGVIGRTVEDAARLLEVVAGHDPLDSTCAELPPPDLLSALEATVEGMVVGVPTEFFPLSLDAGVAAACRAALRCLEGLGVELREVSLPATPYAVPTYYVLATAEASSNLARFDGVRFGARPGEAPDVERLIEGAREGFGPEARRRILLGTLVLSVDRRDAFYARAQRMRERVADDFRRVFGSGVDAVFTPTTPSVAFRLGERLADPYQMYCSDAFTVSAGLAGLPALSLPVGSIGGLPVGGQLIGPPWREAEVLRLARALEKALELARSDA